MASGSLDLDLWVGDGDPGSRGEYLVTCAPERMRCLLEAMGLSLVMRFGLKPIRLNLNHGVYIRGGVNIMVWSGLLKKGY
jgi:hypothetical protein